jgi:hypothetical protein
VGRGRDRKEKNGRASGLIYLLLIVLSLPVFESCAPCTDTVGTHIQLLSTFRMAVRKCSDVSNGVVANKLYYYENVPVTTR